MYSYNIYKYTMLHIYMNRIYDIYIYIVYIVLTPAITLRLIFGADTNLTTISKYPCTDAKYKADSPYYIVIMHVYKSIIDILEYVSKIIIIIILYINI